MRRKTWGASEDCRVVPEGLKRKCFLSEKLYDIAENEDDEWSEKGESRTTERRAVFVFFPDFLFHFSTPASRVSGERQWRRRDDARGGHAGVGLENMISFVRGLWYTERTCVLKCSSIRSDGGERRGQKRKMEWVERESRRMGKLGEQKGSDTPLRFAVGALTSYPSRLYERLCLYVSDIEPWKLCHLFFLLVLRDVGRKRLSRTNPRVHRPNLWSRFWARVSVLRTKFVPRFGSKVGNEA